MNDKSTIEEELEALRETPSLPPVRSKQLLDEAIRLADEACSKMSEAYFAGGYDLKLVHDLAYAHAAASDASGKLKALKAKLEASTSNDRLELRPRNPTTAKGDDHAKS